MPRITVGTENDAPIEIRYEDLRRWQVLCDPYRDI